MGPILYKFFTTDLLRRLENFGPSIYVSSFADDTKIAGRVKTEEEQDILQEAVNLVEEWSQENGLQLNPEKSVILHFDACTRKGKNVQPKIKVWG